MRIAIDARPLSSDNPTGIGVYLLKILSSLDKQDDDNEYILYSNKTISKSYKFSKKFTQRIIDGKIGSFWLRYKIPCEIKKDNIDIFWGTQHLLPRKVNNIEYVLTVHDIALIKNWKWGSYKNAFIQNTLVKKSIREADRVIADSNATRKDLVNYIRIPEKKCKVVYLGIDREEENYTKQKANDILRKYEINKPYYIYIGTIEPRKNIKTIIKAFEKCRNNSIQLVIAGGLGWKYGDILKEIKRSEKAKDIKRIGYVNEDEKKILLKQSIALVFPSHYEGFGIPVLEAMASGTVVITANNSSLKEVGGTAAIYIDNENNYCMLAEKMEKVANLSTGERNKLLLNGKENIENFEWNICASKTREIIEGKYE